KPYARYEDMLDDPAVQLVSECMPNYLHAPDALLALSAGRHLLLEKPAGITQEETDALFDAAKRAKGKTIVSFLMRWNPLALCIRSLIEKGALGDVYFLGADYWHGIKPSFASYEWIRRKEFAGGAMITGGCHAADLARWLNGEVEEVSAYAMRQRGDFDYDTTLTAAVKYRNGSVGRLSASLDGVSFPYPFTIDVLGSKGAVRNERLFSRDLLPGQDAWTHIQAPGPDSGSVSHHPFQAEINELVQAILQDAPVRSTLQDACRSMDVVLAITESAHTGKPVRVKDRAP
ncbi:MAG TPA: Gfo/Idh/MocA family oxidoreductase, partial [Candidatus Limnocylindria bacterium]|nr:Gfo/Idh/MocA family oxidoreductase [Candidatus Limnocylindria bacterium]